GESTQRLVVSGVQVALDTIRVVDRRSCKMTSDASAAATFAAWEQARTALTAAQLTAGSRTLSATTISYDRILEPDQRKVREQNSRITTAFVAQPWRVIPADSLHRAGYVVTDGSNTTWYQAPGIEVLVSPMFLEDHCFHLVNDRGRPAQIGIA